MTCIGRLLNLIYICPKLIPNRNTCSLLAHPPMSNSTASHRAWSLIFEDAMGETDTLYSQGHLKHFECSTRTIGGVNRTIHVTTSRMSNAALKAVSGQEELPIISNPCMLAHMIILSVHKVGGHKMALDTLARCRLIAYTFKPGNLIKRILSSCFLCRIKREDFSKGDWKIAFIQGLPTSTYPKCLCLTWLGLFW